MVEWCGHAMQCSPLTDYRGMETDRRDQYKEDVLSFLLQSFVGVLLPISHLIHI